MEAYKVITKLAGEKATSHFVDTRDETKTLCGVVIGPRVDPRPYNQFAWTDAYQWFNFQDGCKRCAKHPLAPCYDPNISQDRIAELNQGIRTEWRDGERLTNHRWMFAERGITNRAFCMKCGLVETNDQKQIAYARS